MDEKTLYAVQQTLAVATTAGQLASQVALTLHTIGAVRPQIAERWADATRHLGELLQEAGHDDLASDFGAIAALLRKPPPVPGP